MLNLLCFATLALIDYPLSCRQDRNSSQDSRFRPHNKRIWASLQAGKDALIQDVHQEIFRRDPAHVRQHVIVTDGERALQRRVIKIMSNVTLILDLFHVLEYHWSAAHALHPEGSPQAEDFVCNRLRRILHGSVSQVVKGLRQIVTKRHLKGAKADAFSTAADYFYNNRSRMRYHEYLAAGFPIASGPVKSACKTLIKVRMERSGMRWTVPMAEAMLKLRATFLSGDFDDYWHFHVQREQQRLHPLRWTPLPSS